MMLADLAKLRFLPFDPYFSTPATKDDEVFDLGESYIWTALHNEFRNLELRSVELPRFNSASYADLPNSNIACFPIGDSQRLGCLARTDNTARIQFAHSLPNGRFSTPTPSPIGGVANAIALVLIGRPATIGFAVAHSTGISLIRPMPNQPGAFQPAESLLSGETVTSIDAADWNNDGIEDLIALLSNSRQIAYFTGNATGAFTRAQILPFPTAVTGTPDQLVAGDFNGDLALDFLFHSGAGLHAFLNSASGFTTSVLTPIADAITDIAVWKTNNDILDDVLVRTERNVLYNLAGAASGVFQRLSVHSGGFLGRDGLELFRSESVSGVISLGRSTSSLYFNRRQSDGTLASVQGIAFPGNMRVVRVADLNNDRQPDIVAAGPAGVFVRLRQGPNNYAAPVRIGTLAATALEIADANNDGRPDLIILDSPGRGATLNVAANNGNGAFAAPIAVWQQTIPDFEQYSLTVADWNNDQRADLALTAANNVLTFVNTGNLTFRAPATNAAGPDPASSAFADLNNDNLLDLVVLNGRLTVNQPRNISVHLANPDGAFRAPTVLATVPGNDNVESLQVIDVNRDGRLDLAYNTGGNLGTREIRVALAQAGGGYVTSVVATGVHDAFHFGDIDADGIPDLSRSFGDLFHYRGRGDGVFGNLFNTPAGGTLFPANLDNNATVDFAMLNPGSESFVFLIPSPYTSQRNATLVTATTFQATPVAINSIATVVGTGLSTQTASTPTADWPTTLGGVSGFFRDPNNNEYPARLAYVSPTQVNLLIPPSLPTSFNAPMTLFLTASDGTTSNALFRVNGVAPSLFFAGNNLAAANFLRVRDGVQSVEPAIGVANNELIPAPIDLGPEGDRVFLLLFGTGIRNRIAANRVTATVGGVNAPVIFSGPQGQFPGLDQVNVEIPRTLAGRGAVDVVLTVEGAAANTVRIAIR